MRHKTEIIKRVKTAYMWWKAWGRGWASVEDSQNVNPPKWRQQKEIKFKGHLSAWCEGQHIEVNCEGQPLWEATSVRFILRLGNKCEVDFEVRQQMWGYLRLRLRRCEGCGLPAAGGAQVLTPSWHKWVHHHQQYPHFHHHSQKCYQNLNIFTFSHPLDSNSSYMCN